MPDNLRCLDESFPDACPALCRCLDDAFPDACNHRCLHHADAWMTYSQMPGCINPQMPEQHFFSQMPGHLLSRCLDDTIPRCLDVSFPDDNFKSQIPIYITRQFDYRLHLQQHQQRSQHATCINTTILSLVDSTQQS
jgi:hypothetical protein